MSVPNRKLILMLSTVVLTLAACGGPHLVEDDQGLNRALEKPVPAGPLTGKPLRGGDEINFGKLPQGLNPERKAQLSVQEKSDLTYTYELEEGKHFTLHRDKSSCQGDFTKANQCEIVVTFDEQTPGKYRDNIIVKSSDGKQVLIPVTGERLSKPKQENQGNLIFADPGMDNVDYGNVPVGSEVVKTITVENPTETAIPVKEYKVEPGSEFRVVDKGTCGDVIQPGTCSFKVALKPTKRGAKKADLTIVDAEGKTLKSRLTGNASLGNVCIKNEEVEISALSKEKSNSGVVFPYRFSHGSTDSTLEKLYGTKTNATVNIGTRINVVKDAQVLVQYEIGPLKGRVVDAKLKMNIAKVINDEYLDTEMLCLSAASLKRCSGRLFKVEDWLRLKNPAFFGRGGGPVTGTYEEHLALTIKPCGTLRCEELSETFPFAQAMQLNGQDLQTLGGSGLASIIFADDVRLKELPTLILTLEKEVTCGR